jgi:iron complex outermembrane recepter protein
MRYVPYSFAAMCLLLSLLLPATMLLSVGARSQESAPAQAPATESPKAESERPPSSAAPAPAAPGAPSPAPPPASPGSVPVPQVVVKPTAPKPAAPVAGPRLAAPPPPPTAVTAPPRRTALRTRRAGPPAPVAPPQQPQPLPNVVTQRAAQTVTTVSQERIRDAPAFSVEDLLQESPGVSMKQGNGPRDIGISIRGSNARNGFGIRNIVVLEDGFPVTQPDGLSRTDLTDPHAYGGVEVYRGPSSAMFGNYATGGAINFRVRRGGEIDGMINGVEGGSFGYLNNWSVIGNKSANFEGSIFASDVRGTGFIANSTFNTQTVNSLMTYSPTPDDRVTLKVIDNILGTGLPIRLSFSQFQTNPFQHGCATALTAVPGCATVNLFQNGFSNPTVPETAEEAKLGRHDRRTIVGGRWEHDFNNSTTWPTQIVYDDKNINQPTGSTSAIGDSPAYNLISEFTSRSGGIGGLESIHYLAFFDNSQRLQNYTWNVAPSGYLGRLQSFYDGGDHANRGARAREEIKLNAYWTAVAAIGVEYTTIGTVNNLVSSTVIPTVTPSPIQRDYLNRAPEAGLLFRPNEAWQFRSRVSTGYGTPTISNLTVTSAGVSGNNTDLQSQTNVGIDHGVDWTASKTLKLSVTHFYEFFRNEFVTQSPGAGLQNFTTNIPRSEHRGIEVALDWRPLPGWKLIGAYSHNDQFYREYTEQLSAGALTRRFDRADNKIPGVSPNEVATRLGYDQPNGPLQGMGWFVEYVWKDGFFMENANLLKAPAYSLVNFNVHYDREINDAYIRGLVLFFEVKNVLDRTYIASANNITDSINAVTGLQNPGSVLALAGTGSIYAGAPKSFLGGLKLAFR